MASIRHKKSLGQHFLEDTAILQAIVEGAEVERQDAVLEIGPGSGNLSGYLAARAARLVAVEIDTALEPLLRQELGKYPKAEVIFGNFLTMDLKLLHERLGGGAFKVVANLPYYITTPILERLLSSGLPIESITILIQKEAADRLICSPGSREYGPLAIACARWGSGRCILRVPPAAFTPPPKVDSAVVHIVRHRIDPFAGMDEALFWKIVRTAFSQRRKQLKNARSGLGLPASRLEEALSKLGIDGARRPETLTVEEFAALTEQFASGA